MMAAAGIVNTAASLGLGALSIGLIIAFVRLVLGPSLPDRVLALDVVAILLVGMLALYAIQEDEPHVLRVATVLALVNFLGTVAFAAYLRKRGSDD